MLNATICHIFIAFNINFNSKKDLRDTKNCRNCNLQGSGTRQSFTRYVETSLQNQVKQEFHGNFDS